MTEEQSLVLRVFSYNIHKGFGLRRKSFVLDQIRSELSALKPDIVFLQEVIGEHSGHAARVDGWPLVSQFEFLAEGVWPHFVYGKNAIYEKGHHGNAILSKYPIIESSNTDISTNLFEARGVLHAALEIPGLGSPLHCMCVHLNLFRRGRTKQLETMTRIISERIPKDHSLLLAGDFNDWSKQACKVLSETAKLRDAFVSLFGTQASTYPSRFPLLTLDRVYFRGLEALDARVMAHHPWPSLSDHAAIYAEFSLQE